jgi:hypothetical protein
VDGPSEDPAFAFEGRMAGQAPEVDGVVYLRAAASGRARRGAARAGRAGAPLPLAGGDGARDFTPGEFARVRIVEAEGHELVGERA